MSKVSFAIGTFRFQDVDGTPGPEGIPIFVKAAITRAAPWDVRALRKRDPRFPTHSTLDQLFTDQKFESYRTLGFTSAVEGPRRYRRYESSQNSDTDFGRVGSRGLLRSLGAQSSGYLSVVGIGASERVSQSKA